MLTMHDFSVKFLNGVSGVFRFSSLYFALNFLILFTDRFLHVSLAHRVQSSWAFLIKKSKGTLIYLLSDWAINNLHAIFLSNLGNTIIQALILSLYLSLSKKVKNMYLTNVKRN